MPYHAATSNNNQLAMPPVTINSHMCRAAGVRMRRIYVYTYIHVYKAYMARPYTRIPRISALRPRNVYGRRPPSRYSIPIPLLSIEPPLKSSMADEEDVRYGADAGLPPVIRQTAVGVKNQYRSPMGLDTAEKLVFIRGDSEISTGDDELMALSVV